MFELSWSSDKSGTLVGAPSSTGTRSGITDENSVQMDSIRRSQSDGIGNPSPFPFRPSMPVLGIGVVRENGEGEESSFKEEMY